MLLISKALAIAVKLRWGRGGGLSPLTPLVVPLQV